MVLLIGAGAVLIVLGWWFLFYQPRGKDLAEKRTRLEQEKRTEQTLRATLKRRLDLKAQEPVIDSKLVQLAVYMPPAPELPQFIYDATRISKEAGVDFISISPGLPSGGRAGEGVIALSISIRGGFFQLLDYLVRVEKLPRTVRFDSISIAPSVGPGGEVSLDVALAGRMFTDAVPAHVSLPSAPAAAPRAPGSAAAPGATSSAVPPSTSSGG